MDRETTKTTFCSAVTPQLARCLKTKPLWILLGAGFFTFQMLRASPMNNVKALFKGNSKTQQRQRPVHKIITE